MCSEMLTVSKLSKMQKTILENLFSREVTSPYLPSGYWVTITSLSWVVAEKFNNGHKDRIWDDQKQKEQLLERYTENTKDCFNEDGNFKSEQSRQKATTEYKATMQICNIINLFHKKRKRLTLKHRVSFSRSLKRLENRKLVECYVDLRTEKEAGTWFWVWYKGSGRRKYVKLTVEGIKFCRQMLTVNEVLLVS